MCCSAVQCSAVSCRSKSKETPLSISLEAGGRPCTSIHTHTRMHIHVAIRRYVKPFSHVARIFLFCSSMSLFPLSYTYKHASAQSPFSDITRYVPWVTCVLYRKEAEGSRLCHSSTSLCRTSRISREARLFHVTVWCLSRMSLCLFCVKCHASVAYVPWLIHMCAMTQIHMCHDSVAYVVAYHERQGSRLQGLGPWCSVCVCVVQGVVCVLGGGEASDLHREGFDSAHIEMSHVTQMNESRESRH